MAHIWVSWQLPIFFLLQRFYFGVGVTIGWVSGLIFGSTLSCWLEKQSKWSLMPAIFWHGTFDFFTAGDRIINNVPAIISTLAMVSNTLLRTISLEMTGYCKKTQPNQIFYYVPSPL